nr:putative oxidoreductase bli-4, mitochondrial [Quercus suber]
MDYIRTAVAENFGGGAKVAKEHESFSIDTDVPDLSGKTAVLTGGSEGIGFGVSHTLIKHNISKLIIISLRQEVLDEATKAIDEEFGAGTSNKIVFKQCDLSDWDQTAKVAKEIADSVDKIDILVNNAARGIMTQQFAPTNGIDQHMATNHFGHVILTSNLLPVLKKTADAGNVVRIVNLASNLHESAPAETAFASEAELQKDYGPNAQYGRSKLANLIYAKYLAKHVTSAHSNILANATHPGIVDTAQTNVHIHEAFPLLGYGMSVGLKPFRKTQFEGCVSTVYAATAIKDSGLYVAPPRIIEQGSPKANDPRIMEHLMNLTREVVKAKTGQDLKDY